MPQYTISGIPIQFPYEAYPCQITFMEKVIAALKGKENALLESPTGTGKTLCLLCATLAWRESYMRCRQQDLSKGNARYTIGPPVDKSSVSNRPLEENWEDPDSAPKIYYASRTHSQLKQVIKELRQSKYRIKMTVIGSREQLCMHPEVKKLTGTTQSRTCRHKVSQKSCQFYQNVEKNKTVDEIFDIEDLIHFSSDKRVCPYYLSRNNLNETEIIFLPYNYLIDQGNRKQQQLHLQNSIIIFDEAHNLESSCSESASVELSLIELRQCVEEAKHCLTMSSHFGSGDTSPEDLMMVCNAVLGLYEQFSNLSLPATNERVEPGSFIFDLFREQQINWNTAEEFCEKLGKVVDFLLEYPLMKLNKGALAHLLNCIQTLFRSEFTTNFNYTIQFFRVHIKKTTASTPTVAGGPALSTPNLTVSFWCFNAGVAMKDLMCQGVRTCILASGTLSPMNSFAEEMQIKFPHQLENPHVIDKQQLFACVVPNGPNGMSLTSSYAARANMAIQQELGDAFVSLIKAIPQGCLAFFPSYTMMHSSTRQWSRQLHTLAGSKQIFVEPRSKTEFPVLMEAYERDAERGAVLMGVCRGKVSEGVDFSDAKGRAAVVLGIPYPHAGDPKVQLKKTYLEDRRRQHAQHTLSGNEWYAQQASRAVNQAIGRVIRHRHDYGAILLLDTRFSEPQFQRQLSKWVQPHLQTLSSFPQVLAALTLFFQERAAVVVPGPIHGTSAVMTRPAPITSMKRTSGEDAATAKRRPLNANASLSKSFFKKTSTSTSHSISDSIFSKYSSETRAVPITARKPFDVISACDQPLKTVPSTNTSAAPTSSSSSSMASLASLSKLKPHASPEQKIEEYCQLLKEHLPSGTGGFNVILSNYKSKKLDGDQLVDRVFELFTTNVFPPKPVFTRFVTYLPLSHKRVWMDKTRQFFSSHPDIYSNTNYS